jgi:heat shock protein HslJ
MKQFLILASIFMLIGGCSPKMSPDQYWSEKRWVLTEMKGVPVQLSGTRRDAYLEFRWSEKRFTGNGGCNTINGTYTLEKRQLQFPEVTSTEIACNDIEFEKLFLNLLREVDRYEMENADLVMKDGRKVILRFSGR